MKDLDQHLKQLGYNAMDWDRISSDIYDGIKGRLWQIYWTYWQFYTKQTFEEFCEDYQAKRREYIKSLPPIQARRYTNGRQSSRQ